jgi:hypothetical protein
MICAIVGWPTSVNGWIALGQMDVAPAGLDVPEQLMEPHLLVMRDGRLDVPVAERAAVGRLDGDGVAAILDEDLARGDRVDGGAVGRRDVDAEVERVARALHARIVEEAAHRMLAVERLDRPGVGSGQRSALLRRGRSGRRGRRAH